MAGNDGTEGSWRDPRIPPRDVCVLRYALERWADERPDAPYAVFGERLGPEAGRWTYAETRERARRVARALQDLGVGQGDHVAVWLPTGPDVLAVMLGINYLGAVYVPFNTAYRGGLLEHVIENSDARVLITHADLAPRLAEVALARLDTVVLRGGEAAVPPALRPIPGEVLERASPDPDPLPRPIEPWDTQSIIYTSGTTGPSKGVLSSYLHAYTNMGPESWPCIDGHDRYLINLPMFHIGGSFICNIMLCHGGSVALAGDFDTDSFWPTIKETGATAVFLLGVMATFLAKRPPGPEDRDHGLRLAFMVPLGDDIEAFAARFGIEVYTIFNMTEISTPTFAGPNPTAVGTCGRERAGVELRLVDEHDCEVPPGAVGEMIIRTDRPWGMNHGYYRNPEATARAWRNGWFHTGDAFRRDAEGNYYFVDRLKDAIRRRGENVSSFEVEVEVASFPAVREAAAIPVPSELGEDEVMVVVAPVAGARIDPEALFDHLVPRMAHFMLPRYIRVVPELPKTPTAKVRKHLLREDGVAAGTWDREAAGIRVTRDGIRRGG